MQDHVLLIGGHGKVAQHMTPLLLTRWSLTSMIRTQEQVPAIEKLAGDNSDKLKVLVRNLANVESEEDAAAILHKVKPQMIVWSAGAGGKYGPDMTKQVDRDAAIHFINAATSIPTIKRFLLISYNGSRRACAPWWDAAEWDYYNESVNHGVLANYYAAKIDADEALYETGRRSDTLTTISLRPGTLTDHPAGQVSLGKQDGVKRGTISREGVAQVAVGILEKEGFKTCWLDLLSGEDEVEQAVEKCVKENIDAAEGEEIWRKFS